MTDKKGKRLYIEIAKEGYYSSGSARASAFEYADPAEKFNPDPNIPFVFQLRKKGIGADLVHSVQLFGFHTNGVIQYLDLIKGKNSLTPPGDLAVQFIRSPRNSIARYDWSLVISVPDGGILETNEEFMFQAPTDGYQSAITIQVSADDPHWFSTTKRRFYFKSRNGNIYGRAEATIYPIYQKAAAIDMDYYVNPSGSRNLEPK